MNTYDWQKALDNPPGTNETIEMIVDLGFTVLIGKYVEGTYYEYPGLEPWTKNDLSTINSEVILWRYFQFRDKNLMKEQINILSK
jgi:hypothetical protein